MLTGRLLEVGLTLIAEAEALQKALSKRISSALTLTQLRRSEMVSVVRSVAMIAAGGVCAWLTYRYLGLEFVSRSWFNLDATWAVSLILVVLSH